MAPKAWSVVRKASFRRGRGGGRRGVGIRREPVRAWRLDETSNFNHDSTKTCEGLQNPSGAPMGLVCGPLKTIT